MEVEEGDNEEGGGEVRRHQFGERQKGRSMKGNQKRGKRQMFKAEYQRVPWTSQEKEHCGRCFGQFIELKTVPGKSAIERVMNISTEFDRRSWQNVKDDVRISIAKLKKH